MSDRHMAEQMEAALLDALSPYDRARVRAGECTATEAYEQAIAHAARRDAALAEAQAAARAAVMARTPHEFNGEDGPHDDCRLCGMCRCDHVWA